MKEFSEQRQQMVEKDIAPRVRDSRVLTAMSKVRREDFVPESERDRAYADRPLPIGDNQTISQPLVVAMMAEAAEIKPEDRILEIGTGSGYGAAVLAELGQQVVTIERIHSLAEAARKALAHEHIGNAEVIEGDGSKGYAPAAPYDAIIVTAAGPEIPPSLVEQLAMGGRLVMPVGPQYPTQDLIRVRKGKDGVARRENLGPVSFVPLIGEEGWGRSHL